MNKTQVTLTGLVGTTPRQVRNSELTQQTTFRLVTVEDDESAKTNWFTIKSYGQLAENVYESIQKGNRVVLTGDLEVNDWDNGEMTGTTVEVIVSAIGHDLTYNTTVNTRVFNAEVMA